jgi:hypothetical protein
LRTRKKKGKKSLRTTDLSIGRIRGHEKRKEEREKKERRDSSPVNTR